MKNRSLQFTAPNQVELITESLNLDDIPDKHVLVKNAYSLISVGTELACLSGNESWFDFPGKPGYCSVGEIAGIGSQVTNFKTGDKVYTFGTHTEYEMISSEAFIVKVPETIDAQWIPFTRISTIAMTALRVSSIQLGDYVAVTGQGLIGNLALQLAGLQGAFTIAIDVIDSRLSLSGRCGADYLIDSKQEDVFGEVMEITTGAGAHTLIEATGVPAVLENSLASVGKGGEAILLGSPRGEYFANLTGLLNHSHLASRDIVFKGAHEWKYPVAQNDFVKHSFVRNTRIVLDLMEKKKLKIDPLISDVMKPESAAQAYANLKDKQKDYVGVLFDWN